MALINSVGPEPENSTTSRDDDCLMSVFSPTENTEVYYSTDFCQCICSTPSITKQLLCVAGCRKNSEKSTKLNLPLQCNSDCESSFSTDIDSSNDGADDLSRLRFDTDNWSCNSASFTCDVNKGNESLSTAATDCRSTDTTQSNDLDILIEKANTVFDTKAKAMFDTVFCNCDIECNGTVVPSNVISFIKNTISFAGFDEDRLASLQQYLDADCSNRRLNSAEYLACVSAWMHSLGVSTSSDELSVVYGESFSVESVFSDTSNISPTIKLPCAADADIGGGDNQCAAISDKAIRTEHDAIVYNAETEIDEVGLNASLEVSSGSDLNVSELQNRIAVTEYQNKKLLDELAIRTQQLEASDDLCLQLSIKIDNLNGIIKSHKAIDERITELRLENNELRAELIEADEGRRRILKDKEFVEQCLNTSKGDVDSLKNQISMLQSEVDSSMDVHQQLKTKIIEQIEYEREKANYEKLLMEYQMQMSELRRQHAELVNFHQCLKDDKEGIERELADALQTIHCSSGTLHASEVDCESNEDCDTVRHINLTASILGTSCDKRTLCREITSAFISDPSFPSPLCDKELEDSIVQLSSCIYDEPSLNSLIQVCRHVPEIISLQDESNTQTETAAYDVIRMVKIDSFDEFQLISNGSSQRQRFLRTSVLRKPAAIHALLQRDIKNIIDLAISKDLSRFKQFVRRFIDQLVTVILAKDRLENSNLMLSAMLQVLKSFQVAEADRYKKAYSDFNHFSSYMSNRLRQIGQRPETVDVCCDTLDNAICPLMLMPAGWPMKEKRDGELHSTTADMDVPLSTKVHYFNKRRRASAVSFVKSRSKRCNIFSVFVTILVTLAIVICLLVGIGHTSLYPVTLRHFSRPPM